MEWAAIFSPGDLNDPGIEPISLVSLALADGFFTTAPSRKPTHRHEKPRKPTHINIHDIILQ